MNKTVIVILAVVALLIAGGAFFALSGNETDQVVDTAEPAQTDQLRTDASGAAGTSLFGSENAGRDDAPIEAGEQNANYQIDAFNHGFSIEQIKAAPGDTVTVELTSTGGTHDFVIDELNVRSDVVNTGGKALVTFTIPESAKGQTYEYYCSVMNHRAQGMVGQLVISE